MNHATRHPFRNLMTLASCLLIAACGGGGGASPTPVDQPPGGPPGSPAPHTVGGTVTGLSGSGLVLQNNGGDDRAINGNTFTFTAQPVGSNYAVTVLTQPSSPAQNCTVTNGTGQMGQNDVTNVEVACLNLSAAVAQADAGFRSATISWTGPDTARFNVYTSSQRNCDIGNFASCRDGKVQLNATSPLTIGDLRNGQAYFFQLETVRTDGARELSAEVFARPNVLAFNHEVHAIAPAADGTVYVGGDFTEVSVVTGSAVPTHPTTGRLAAPDFPMVNGEVLAIAPDGSGGWYIGGDFTSVGGVPRNNLAHLLAAGGVDPNWRPGTNDPVDALAVSGNAVYVGGRFSQVTDSQGGTVARRNLAALDAVGAVRSDWDPDAGGPVNALAISGDVVFVGGFFVGFGDGAAFPHRFLAGVRVADGVPIAWLPNPDNAVRTLAVRDGIVYAGGHFTQVGGQPRTYLAAFNLQQDASGAPTAWIPQIDIAPTNRVLAIAPSSDGTVYVIGGFEQVFNAGNPDPLSRNGLAAFAANGAATPWNPAANRDSNEGSIALSPDGRTVYVGGQFERVNLDTAPAERRFVAAFDAQSGVVTSWNPKVDGVVSALSTSDSVVYVAGDFGSAGGGVVRNNLAALDASGALTSWNPGIEEFARVHALAWSETTSTLYVAGSFSRVNGVLRKNFAAFNSDGVLQEWDPNADSAGAALAFSEDGTIVYAVGSFEQIGDGNSRGLAALDPVRGDLMPGWGDPEINGVVSAVAASNGNVYAGGSFQQVGAVGRRFLAAFHGGNGSLRPMWDPQPNGSVRALAIAGATLYAGGSFNNVNVGPDQVERRNLAAFHADAGGRGVATNWDPNVNHFVHALVVSGNTIYASGLFSNVNLGADLLPRRGLAAFDALTGTATGWDPSPAGDVNAIAVSGPNTVYVGGSFIGLRDQARGNFGAVDAQNGELIP